MLFSLHFVLLSVAVVVDSTIKDCITASGEDYRGEKSSAYTGQTCLNWTNTTRDYDVTSRSDYEHGVGDHNYCRNPDVSSQPWCYVSSPDAQIHRLSCALQPCEEQAVPSKAEAGSEAEPAPSQPAPIQPAPGRPAPGRPAPGRPAPGQGEGAAVQPVMGISQRVRTGPTKKKDLGTLGYVLGILMMGLIIVLGVGISVGYFYKRGRDLKKHHEQRVYEREMQRITLPLSAFSNPTCELMDENTIVITARDTTPGQDGGVEEGGDALMASAGTPGA
ncbi:phosphoinositide-3-kinase-interacting protein 1 [Osmerus eperlanus]|uniref:phosphoinositide-3-kinase-interacting protein 1 n=1 Tax=Osmerus eperlanus TaxID=29151 RepID=UPI002E0D7BCC